MPIQEQSPDSLPISFDELEQFVGCRLCIEHAERIIPYGMPSPFSGIVVLKELRAQDQYSKTFLIDDKEHSFVKITPASRVSFVSIEPIKKHIIDLKRHISEIRINLRDKGFELEE